MSTAAAEAVFSTGKLDVLFLSPELAPEAGKALLGAPGFFKGEYEADPDPGLVTELVMNLLTGEPPPGVKRAMVFPLGLVPKATSGIVGVAHLILGFPSETETFLGMLVIAEAHQRKGLGRDFVQGVYDWARPQGIGFLRVRIHPKLAGGKAFLDKLGFAELPNRLSSGHEVWQRKLPATEE